jgi:hypothetical protein
MGKVVSDIRKTHMRKLWVKAWITLDGVFDADTITAGKI